MMRMCKCCLSVSILLLMISGAFAQADYAQSRKGDKHFEEGRFQEAETSYRKAFELTPKVSTSYNLANSMFLQDRIPEAIEEYKKSIASSDSPEVKSKAYYNMGNAY